MRNPFVGSAAALLLTGCSGEPYGEAQAATLALVLYFLALGMVMALIVWIVSGKAPFDPFENPSCPCPACKASFSRVLAPDRVEV